MSLPRLAYLNFDRPFPVPGSGDTTIDRIHGAARDPRVRRAPNSDAAPGTGPTRGGSLSPSEKKLCEKAGLCSVRSASNCAVLHRTTEQNDEFIRSTEEPFFEFCRAGGAPLFGRFDCLSFTGEGTGAALQSQGRATPPLLGWACLPV
jgi:hypothetical protein